MSIFAASDVGTLSARVRELIADALIRLPAQGILFSGGLDTSILAALCPRLPCINLSLAAYGTDLPYAQAVAAHLGLAVQYRIVGVEEALAALPDVIRILRSFDPAIPNDLPVYFGLRHAHAQGITSLYTGDAADELFGGYGFMRDIGDLSEYIRFISPRMFFSSNVLSAELGMCVSQPFADSAVRDFAVESVPVDMKIASRRGVVFGKWLLRTAFSGILPESIVWQSKRPLEIGSGTVALRRIISSRISDRAFARKQRRYPIRFYDKEHLYYYEIYRNVVGDIPRPQSDEIACPGCTAGILPEARHCRICGWCRPV